MSNKINRNGYVGSKLLILRLRSPDAPRRTLDLCPCFSGCELGTLRPLIPNMTIRRNGISVGLAATVGCLWAIPYLTSIGAGIAWFIPGLLLLIAGARTRLSPFQMGFISGLYFHLTALHWLLFIPVKVGAVIGWLSLSAYCALYPALWLSLIHI